MGVGFQPFDVGPFTFTDVHTFQHDSLRLQRMRDVGTGQLKALIARTRDTRLCDTQLVTRRMDEAWKAAKRVNRELTRAEFRATFDPHLTDADCDDRLGQHAFEVTRGRQMVGAFYLYNVRLVAETEYTVEATAYPAPGLPFVDVESWVQGMKRFMLTFLRRDLVLEDGRVFRLLAWEFPTQPGHRWRGERWADQLMADLRSEGQPQDVKPDGSVRRVRRILSKGRF